ncbi:MAG: hypothetical protein ACFCU1_06725 [Sumerlaeia bacterium]
MINTTFNTAILTTIMGVALLAITAPLNAQHVQLPPHLDVNNLKRATPDFSKGTPTPAVQPTAVLGTGPNYAVLVVDFNDGPTTDSFTWGFRWSGTATAKDFLDEVAANDPRFFEFSGTAGSFGVPLYGLAYDADGDLNPDVSFFPYGPNGRQPAPSSGAGSFQVTGPWTTANADGNAPNDPDDNYQSGWFSDGFWGLYSSSDGSIWASSFVGIDGFTLVDNEFIALSFWPGFTEVLPTGLTPAFIDQAPAVAYDGGTTLELNQLNDSVTIRFGFNEAVQGVDVSDLLVSGSASKSLGAKATTVASATNVNPSTIEFVVTDVQAGTLDFTLAPDPGDLQDLQGNNVSSLSGSFTVVINSSLTDWQLMN